MMMVKLVPDVEAELPLTAYYGVTLLGLHAGDSGVSSCVLNICGTELNFRTGDSADQSILYVNGNPTDTPTFRLLPNIVCKMTLTLPKGATSREQESEFLLEHYLSYGVPTGKTA